MGSTPYEVWATGKLAEGVSRESVADQTRTLFPGATPAQRARFISGQPFRVTTVTTDDAAAKVIATLGRIGVLAEVRSGVVSPELTVELSAVEAPPAVPMPATQPAQPAANPTSAAPSRWAWLGIGVVPTSKARQGFHWGLAAVLLLIGLLKQPLGLILAALVVPPVWPRLPIKVQGGVALFAGLTLLTGPLPKIEPGSGGSRTTAVAAERAKACQADLECIADKLQVDAAVRCPKRIEALGQYAARWPDGSGTSSFARIRWANPEHSAITYSGDRLEMQNGFGAWRKMSYECDLDIATQAVLDVRVR